MASPHPVSRSTALVLACALFAPGCYSTLTIPIDEVPRLARSGAARTSQGGYVRIGDMERIEPVARDMNVYRENASFELVPELPRAGLVPADVSVSQPQRVGVSPSFIQITGRDRTVKVPRESVSYLVARSQNTDKTATVAIGATLGAAGFVGLVAGIVALASSARGQPSDARWSFGL